MNSDVTVTLINGAVTLGGIWLTKQLAHRDPAPTASRAGIVYTPSGSEVNTLSVRSHVAETAASPQSRQDSSVATIDRIFGPVWNAATRLRPLRRRVRPWLATVIGYVFGGIGLALYFRTWTDVIAAVALVLVGFVLGAVVYITTGVALSFWAAAALPALYGYVRASASNRTYPVSSGTRVAAV